MSAHVVIPGIHSDDRGPWLAARSRGIGSSDAAAILGVNPWSSAMEVYADKLGLRPPQDDSEPAYWGRKLEPLVLERFAQDSGREVEQAGELIQSVQRPWQQSTLDGRQWCDEHQGPGLAEVKCTRLRWRWEDELPPYVDVQVQHQFAVTGYHWGSILVLFQGCDFKWRDVTPNPAKIEQIIELEERFWQRLQDGDPPETDESESCREAIRALWPSETAGKTVTLPDTLSNVDMALCAAQDARRELDKEILAHQNEIRKAMADAEIGHIGMHGATYTYTTNKNGSRVLRRKK